MQEMLFSRNSILKHYPNTYEEEIQGCDSVHALPYLKENQPGKATS